MDICGRASPPLYLRLCWQSVYRRYHIAKKKIKVIRAGYGRALSDSALNKNNETKLLWLKIIFFI